MEEEILEYTIEDDNVDRRIDVFVSEKNDKFSRSQVQKLIEDGHIIVNDKNVKSNYKLRLNDKIKVKVPKPEVLNIVAEDIDIEILYEDDDVVVVNKPQGMVVHPAVGNYNGTLVNALLGKCKRLSSINGVIRPGIVHRIDKDTSGVLVVAKNDVSHRNLAEQIKEHTVKRIYIALVEGVIKDDNGTIDAPIGRHPIERKKMAITSKHSRNAVTHFRVLKRFKNMTLIEAKLETGRTHQIRVHMASIAHPVVGDPVYGYKKQKFNLKGQALHAKCLGFIHPRTGEYMEFTAPLPEYFEGILKKLEYDK